MKQTMSCEVAPTYVMTIIVRPLTGSPPCASLRSPARAAPRAHLRTPPLGAGARLEVQWTLIRSYALGKPTYILKKNSPPQVSILSLTTAVAFAAEAVKGLRYAPMNSANNKAFAAPLTAFLAAAHGYIELLTQLRATGSNPYATLGRGRLE